MLTHSKIINSQDWEDFSGNEQVSILEAPLSNAPFFSGSSPVVLEAKKHDFDSYAKQAGAAFKDKEITRERLASILDLRSILTISPQVTLYPLEQLECLSDLDDSEDHRAHFLRHIESIEEDPEDWSSLLNAIPKDERFYAEVIIDIKEFTDDRLLELLVLANETGVIYLHDIDAVKKNLVEYNQGLKQIKFDIPSVTARDVFTKKIYENDARSLLPRVGVFTTDDIERSVRNKMRYAVFSYPGVKDTTEFHGINAPIFFMSLHDEIHRRLMSSIPTKALDAYLIAIDLVREKTGIYWSEDIWNSLDLEIGDFLKLSQEQRKNEKNIMYYFETLLNAKKYSTEEDFGLFSVKSSSLDTLCILMLDLVNNAEKWKRLGIEGKNFKTGYYVKVFKFIESNIQALEGLNGAEQVALLVYKGLHPGADTIDANTFKNSHFEKQDGYIQVVKSDTLLVDQSKAYEAALTAFKFNLNFLNKLLGNQKKLTIPEVQGLGLKAKLLKESLEEEVKGNKISLKEMQHITKLLELTAYLLRNPANQYLQNKYAAIAKLEPREKREDIPKYIGLFNDNNVTSKEHLAMAVLDQAKRCPADVQEAHQKLIKKYLSN